MATNDFLPFAQGGGANVLPQVDYVSLPDRTTGFQPGLARSLWVNKVWRQAACFVYVLGQSIVDELGEDALDNADLATLLAQFKRMIATTATPTRIITASANFSILASDYAIGLNRVAGLAACNGTLPVLDDALAGKEFVVDDISGNLFSAPVTILPPAGTISGLPSFVMNENRQSQKFRWYGSNTWALSS